MKSAAFTGHRPQKLNGYKKIDNFETLLLLEALIVESIVERDVTEFISGMAQGIDLWAAEIVLGLKEKFPQIKLVAAIPCIGQKSIWPKSAQNFWNEIKSKADEVVYVNEKEYFDRCLQLRNEYMVDRADYILAVWDGSSGGTGNCIRYARDMEKEILSFQPIAKGSEDSKYLLEMLGKLNTYTANR